MLQTQLKTPLTNTAESPAVQVFDANAIRDGKIQIDRLAGSPRALSHHPNWLRVLDEGLKQTPYCLVATTGAGTSGFLPLSFVSSRLFGKYLVSLPYLNSTGVQAETPAVAAALVSRAVELADQLGVKNLELRHEEALSHPALNGTMQDKVHMRLDLPDDSDVLWKAFKPKVRNQIRKGEKSDFTVAWGGAESVNDFYDVFSHNMRDLGTPVYSKKLFQSIIKWFPKQAEFCTIHDKGRPIAAALVTHGSGISEVPSASSLRSYNSTNVNMFMYWQLLQRAIERRQGVFDFGRSTKDSNTYRFKKQWGALPEPAIWQYYLRSGSAADLRKESGKYDRFISLWQRLPLPLTRLIGPPIVRGIP